jgi:small subunit ribosomal protein S35
MAAPNAHLSRICLRAAPRPASPAAASLGVAAPLSSAPAARRPFSSSRPRPKSVASIGKRIKLPQKPRAPEAGRPEREEEIQYEEIKPADILDDMTKKWKKTDLDDVRAVQAGLYPGADGAGDRPTRTLVDEVREMADVLDHAGRTQSADRIFDKLAEDDKPDTRSFWYDEDDPETITEQRDDNKDPIDMPETAHIKLEELREARHWTRVAAWEMPLLARRWWWWWCSQTGVVSGPPADVFLS